MRRPGRQARRVLAGAVVVAVVGGGYAAYAASADTASYRTVAATTGDVQETLSLSGTVEPVGRADLSFATSGTIATVGVGAGDRVKRGQVLGTLETTSLRNAVRKARSTLASARAQLESDEDAQTSTVSSASSSSTPSTSQSSAPQTAPSQQPTQSAPSQEPTDTPTQGSGDSDALDAALAQLADEQDAVTGAQSTVSASLAAANDALAAQQAACATAFGTDDGTGSTDDANAACTTALSTVQTAQAQVATDQQTLQDALEALAGTLTDAVAALQSTPSFGGDTSEPEPTQTAEPTEQAQPTQQAQAAPASSSQQSTPTGSTGSVTVSAATLARDQAAIDQAKVDLITAEDQLRMATISAPFSGRVVAVDAAAGDSVASGTAVFTLVSQGTTTVEVAASSTQVQQLEVGQQATATPAGSDTALAGTVSQISSIPDDDSTYPVTITLTRKHLDVAIGVTAAVSVVTGSADDVVTVPASALSGGSVTVVKDGVATPTRVTTGVVGATEVEITDGLEKGDEVVLADLDAALPTTDTSDTGGFGGGGFPGGGTFPAGGPGGGPVMMQRGG
ncbi:HlyD family efflux transporter periplasmic adaptor subunit [Nocardioides sp. CN2-186]|uniref:HlyD family efflux transporter periplasmic adaptor subunit n=1 Tax=Nocardioides tweenelious TaxID=3156607 RepID=UPI0032B5BF27